MFYLGLIVSTCYIPGITGVSIPTQWAVLSAILPLTLWRTATLGPTFYLGLTVLAFASLSTLWAPSHYDSGYGLWLACIWFLAFRLGATTADLSAFFRGLAIGLAISSMVAILQWFAVPLPILAPYGLYPSGLFYNSTLLGAIAALVILGLIEDLYIEYIPLALPALILSQSRGAWLALTTALAIRWFHPLLAAIGTLAIATTFLIFLDTSNAERLTIWGVALRELSTFGFGIGSFNSIYYTIPGPQWVHPEFAHNDYLQLWFELGIMAIPIYLVLALALTQRHAALIGFAILSCFYFPLWCPVPALIGCILTGRGVRDWRRARAACDHRGPNLLPRPSHPRSIVHPDWRQAIPSLPPA